MYPDGTIHGWSPLSAEDNEMLRQSLGREPHPVLAVASRCADGSPQVIVNDPLLLDDQGAVFPFPTLFWLVSPKLTRAVDRLESEGWIGRFRDGLIGRDNRSDRREHVKHGDAHSEMLEGITGLSMVGAHRETARLRLTLADPIALATLKQKHPSRYDVIANTGVAGLRDATGVKCLHAHLADYLARPGASSDTVNVIGKAVAALVNKMSGCDGV